MKNITQSLILLICFLFVSCEKTWVCYCDSSKFQNGPQANAVKGYTKSQARKTCKNYETDTQIIGFTPDKGCSLAD